ncbi:MAG: DUF5362 family protein [Candidatus Neomarinimicrobiota bacterium]
MTEPHESPPPVETLELSLSIENQWMLEKLATWSKVVAIVNIIFGILNCLTIFALSIPTVVIGVFMILMGTRLNSAAAHFRYSLYHRDSASFATALQQLRTFMLYNGILLLLVVVLIATLFIILLTAGSAFYEFFQEYMGAV